MPTPQRPGTPPEQQDLMARKRRYVATENKTATKMGPRRHHPRDLQHDTHRRPDAKPRFLSTDEKEWAINQMHNGGRRALDVARDLGRSKSSLNKLCFKFRSGEPLPLSERAAFRLSSEDTENEYQSIEEEELPLLHRLGVVESWIGETRDRLAGLKREGVGESAWQNLHDMINILSTTIHIIKFAELQRIHLSSMELDVMCEQMGDIGAMLERFGGDSGVKPKRRRLSFRLVNRAEDGIPSIEESAKRILASEDEQAEQMIQRADSMSET